MEIIEDNCNLESNFHNDSSSLYHSNSMPDDNLSSIFEMGSRPYDASICRSFENFSLFDGCPLKSSDDMSDNTSSSMENEFEVLLHDYSIIKKCLLTECCQRSDSEIHKLSQLLESIEEFRFLNSSDMEMVCQFAKLLTIDQINIKIIKKFSTKNKWFFVLSGSLRLEGDTTTILTPGSFLGTILDSPDILTEECDVYSNSDHCELMMIGKEDLIPSQGIIIKTSNEDRTVIAVYETTLHNSGHPDNLRYMLSKGTPEILTTNLLSNPRWGHREFVEDFFMTHKIFFPPMNFIMEKIIEGLNEDSNESKLKFDIFIRWLSQNFKEFEKDEIKKKFIDDVATILIDQKNQDYLYWLYDSCSSYASTRYVKCRLSFTKNVVSVSRENDQTMFYIHNIEKNNKLLMNGDIIIAIEDYLHYSINEELIKKFCEEQKELSFAVRNDLLGYHECVLKDVSFDSCSFHSNPSNSTFSQCHSDKISDSVSISTNDSDVSPSIPTDTSPNIKKRPSLIPSFLSNIQYGNVGRFLKNPRYYSNMLKRKYSKAMPMINVPNNRSISDVSSMNFNTNFQRSNISGSTMSVQRFSRRLKHNRKSAGSNPEIIKSFDDKDINENNVLSLCPAHQNNIFPIRIYFKYIFLHRSESLHNSTNKSELQSIHMMIKSTMPVSEVIILALLQLNLQSVSSNEFYLVEVKVDESNMMIHEKILKPTSTNLKLKVHSRFYLKHSSFIGNSLILQKEAEKMIDEFQLFSLLKLPISELIVELFIRSYKLICNISPIDLISHVTHSKATLKIHRQSNQAENEFDKYIQLSDFYKNWVISEICSEQICPIKRARVIQYFIWLAYKAQLVGHIDLFFSLISGLDSTEISRLTLSWDKVSNRDKKLFSNLKKILNVSNNMRYLRVLQQKISSPFIPVTALVIKDLTMIEETNPTFVEGNINGLQVNKSLVNFDKMRKMARLSRTFINSTCTCEKDKSKPVLKHFFNCTSRLENEEFLRKILYKKMEETSRVNHIDTSISFDRKHSTSNASVKSSSSESISQSTSPLKVNSEFTIFQAFNLQQRYLWIDFYLSKLKDMVITDPTKLLEISLVCEANIQNNQNTLKSKLVKPQKSQDDLIFNHNHFQSSAAEINAISDKAAEILGIKAKSTIHKFKKCNES